MNPNGCNNCGGSTQRAGPHGMECSSCGMPWNARSNNYGY